MIAAGELRERVTLQKKNVSGKDAMGGEIFSFSEVATVWAKAMPVGGREIFAAQQLHAETAVRFIVRRRDDVAPEWRLIWEGKTFDITYVAPLPQDTDALELTAVAGLRDG